MVEQKYINAIVEQMVKQKLNDHRRKFLISCIKNLLFDVETYEQQFLDMGVPSDICKVLIDEVGLKTKLPESWAPNFAAKCDKKESEIDMENTCKLVECLFLLQKSPILFEVLRNLKVQDILLKVKIPNLMAYVDVRHRMDELIIQLSIHDVAQENSQGMIGTAGVNQDEEKLED